MKTSNRIALYFTLFSSILLLIFWLALNAFLGSQRYQWEIQELENTIKLQWGIPRSVSPNEFGRRQQLFARFANTITLPSDDPDVVQLMSYSKDDALFMRNIINFEWRDFLYIKQKNLIHLRDVTQNLDRQESFFKSTIIAVLLFALLSYIFGKWFTRYALRDLDKLSSYVKKLDVDSLTKEVDFTHLPDDDKIKIVSNSIHKMQSTIKDDVDRIKRFVSNVSHEFKTPLMMMMSGSELSLASKTYKKWLQQNVQDIQRMNTLLDSLIELTHVSKMQKYTKKTIKLESLVNHISQELESKYDKQQELSINIDKSATILADRSSLELIVSNLLDNAYKYAPIWAKIDIECKNAEKEFSISNTGSSIPEDKIRCIREPFWQVDTSKEKDQWFGLGLALVKELVEKNDRKIKCMNTNEWVIFSINTTN